MFCATHAERQVPLDKQAEFCEDGNWWRACEGCYVEWVDGLSAVVDEDGNIPEDVHVPGRRRVEGEVGMRRSFVGSLSKDWNWSTF